MKIIKQAFQASRPVRWTVIAVATTVLVSVVPVSIDTLIGHFACSVLSG